MRKITFAEINGRIQSRRVNAAGGVMRTVIGFEMAANRFLFLGFGGVVSLIVTLLSVAMD